MTPKTKKRLFQAFVKIDPEEKALSNFLVEVKTWKLPRAERLAVIDWVRKESRRLRTKAATPDIDIEEDAVPVLVRGNKAKRAAEEARVARLTMIRDEAAAAKKKRLLEASMKVTERITARVIDEALDLHQMANRHGHDMVWRPVQGDCTIGLCGKRDCPYTVKVFYNRKRAKVESVYTRDTCWRI